MNQNLPRIINKLNVRFVTAIRQCRVYPGGFATREKSLLDRHQLAP
jgi:hypothetical protein